MHRGGRTAGACRWLSHAFPQLPACCLESKRCCTGRCAAEHGVTFWIAAYSQAALTREEAKLRQRSLDNLGVPPFGQVLKVRAGAGIRSSSRPRPLEASIRRGSLEAANNQAPVAPQPPRVPWARTRRGRACAQLPRARFRTPAALQAAGCSLLVRGPASILQLNIGLYCNQACRHCHVESSPMWVWVCACMRAYMYMFFVCVCSASCLPGCRSLPCCCGRLHAARPPCRPLPAAPVCDASLTLPPVPRERSLTEQPSPPPHPPAHAGAQK